MEIVENRKIVTQAIEGDFQSFTQAFQLESYNTHTKLTYFLDYQVPSILGGLLLDRILVRRTLAEEIEKGLRRVKKHLEQTWNLFSNALQR